MREVGDELELLERVAVKLAVHRLNLHEGQLGVDRHVGAGEADVGEQRAEPAVGLDDPSYTS